MRRITAVAAVMAVLAAGFFAVTETKIELSSAKPAARPSDDEIYTGSILFVPDDGGNTGSIPVERAAKSNSL
jgi:hypothetical protein